MTTNDLMAALSAVEKTEANLAKVERVWDELQALFPSGLNSGDFPEYDDKARSLDHLLSGLPLIDGWRPALTAPDIEGVSQTRLDLMELADPVEAARFEGAIWSDGRQLGDYRFRIDRLRRKIIRSRLFEAMDAIEAAIAGLKAESAHVEHYDRIPSERWHALSELAKQIDVMLGSHLFPQEKWGYFKRHVHFACRNDLADIEKQDWPFVRRNIEAVLYARDEPVPVDVADLSSLISSEPKGEVITALQWSKLDATQFERLIYTLVNSAPGYENAEWSMHTNAPDKGRDLSAIRVQGDTLSGVDRKRVVIQCKHWTTKSISQTDAHAAMSQTAMWTDPRVDVLVLATSGRFTADALQWIERHNASTGMPKIETWPESRLEALLSTRSAIVAEFGLRRTDAVE